MQEHITLSLVGISFLSMLCQYLSWWIRIPSILFLLIAGLVLGPVLGYLNPHELLGDLLYPIVSLSVAIILFEGSLTLKFRKIKEQKSYIIRFISIGGIITFLSVACAAYFIFNINLSIAFLIGSILTVTGPTVIAPMLKTIRPKSNVCEASKWEGIVLDPFGAILTVLVFELITGGATMDGSDVLTSGLKSFILMTSTGLIIGHIFGLLLSEILIRHLIPKFLINIAVLNFVLLAFLISNILYNETGLLAVTIIGITLANRPGLDLNDIIEFKETLSTLLISALFILLAAGIDVQTLFPLVIPSLILFITMQFLIRPIKVFLTTIHSDLTLSDKAMLIWIAPRGIVAVAIASLFEYKLISAGITEASVLTPVVFLIIVWSVLLPGLTGKMLAKKLNANQPDPNGILILGANTLSINIAKELTEHNLDVLLIDSNWDEISQARMNGIKTYYSNLASIDAEYDIAIQKYGKMLSITPSSELTALAKLHFKRDIESKDIYYLQSEYDKLTHLIHSGFELKSTLLSEQYTFDNYLKKLHNGVLLFALNLKHELIIFATDSKIKPEAGWVIISMMKP